MTDEKFLRLLESCALPESDFRHADHIRAAYLYLQQVDFACALARMSSTIRNYGKHLGKSDLYHETITVAYMALIQQRICERGNGGDWTAFARDNPELFQRGLLRRFYPQAQLESAIARKTFILPHSLPTASAPCARF
jgi:hypothetical protein